MKVSAVTNRDYEVRLFMSALSILFSGLDIFGPLLFYDVSRVAQSVQRLTTGWTVRDRIPVGTRFSARPDRLRGPPIVM